MPVELHFECVAFLTQPQGTMVPILQDSIPVGQNMYLSEARYGQLLVSVKISMKRLMD